MHLLYVMDYDGEEVIARCDNRVDAERIAKEWEEEWGEPAMIWDEERFWNRNQEESLQESEEDDYDECLESFNDYDPDDVAEDDTENVACCSDADLEFCKEVVYSKKDLRSIRDEIANTLNCGSSIANQILIKHFGFDPDELYALPFDYELN